MKKSTFLKISLLAVLGLASVVFNACKDPDPKPSDTEQTTTNPSDPKPTDPSDPKPTDPSQTNDGVVINGVKWATRNVDAFGTFAATPESAGMFYQWNRKKAWAATGTVTGWDATFPTGTTWEKANDPSPKGWRVPTKEEMNKLCDKTKVTNEWTTQNGVGGQKFTDKSTGASVFFPAAGHRGYNDDDGAITTAGEGGCYWSSTSYESNEFGAYHTSFYKGYATGVYDDGRNCGFSVRSVAE